IMTAPTTLRLSFHGLGLRSLVVVVFIVLNYTRNNDGKRLLATLSRGVPAISRSTPGSLRGMAEKEFMTARGEEPFLLRTQEQGQEQMQGQGGLLYDRS